MKKIKISLLIVFIAVIVVISFASITKIKSKDIAFALDSSYITAENIALNSSDKSRLTDGKADTSYFSLSKKGEINIDFKKIKEFNCIVLKEKGLNIKSFTMLASENGEEYYEIYTGDKIEYHRLCTFDTVNARYIRIFINDADSFWSLKEIEVYNQPKVSSDSFMTLAYVTTTEMSAVLEDNSVTDKKNGLIKTLESRNFKALTDVNFYCGLSFDEKGNVFFSEDKEENEKKKADTKLMLDCMRTAGNKKLKITYVIGNWSNNPATNTAMADNKDAFIENLIDLCVELGVDGIDIDYEFPQSDYDFKVFDLFLIELKKAMLQNDNMPDNPILSCAFGTRDAEYSEECIKSLDRVNMMTYDIFDQDGEHSSFWSCAVQGAKYLENTGFSKAQINIGIPFYGTQTDALMEQYIYKDIKAFDYYKNRFVFNSYYDGSPCEVYFNSPAMVRDKTAYALLNGYGGIMVWSFDCDTDYNSKYSLWRAAYDAISQFGGDEK